MLQNEIYPQIQAIVNNNNNEFERDIVFQQDGAPPHYSGPVKE